MDNLLKAALAYATKGKSIFPVYEIADSGQCTCGGSVCHPGKHPRTKNGLKDATRDPEQIRKWWERWPSANIGMATGNGLLVVDVDMPDGPDTLKALEKGSSAKSVEIFRFRQFAKLMI